MIDHTSVLLEFNPLDSQCWFLCLDISQLALSGELSAYISVVRETGGMRGWVKQQRKLQRFE